jgi:hypothetical protein
VNSLNSLQSQIFKINKQNFDRFALKLFQFQYDNNSVYRDYVQFLDIKLTDIDKVSKIPFLPIQFFKTHQIKTGEFIAEKIFESSGTTGTRSKHYIENTDFYKKISLQTFSSFFGDLNKAIVIGLLPSYLERKNSSLVYMVNHFIEQSNNDLSGFYLNNLDLPIEKLVSESEQGKKIFLFGVTFALLEMAKKQDVMLKNLVILETGGMKGRGRELIREELHEKLKSAFHTDVVYSEYGMTELLSQAYLKADGLFHTPPWMRIMIRDLHDPFHYLPYGRTGGVNVIDLANIHSCAFIETEDLGLNTASGFNVLGRSDNSELRGCNLLLS